MRSLQISQIQGSKTTKWLFWILKCLIAIGILCYIFSIIPISEVLAVIASTKWGYIAVAYIVLILEKYAGAVRQKILTDMVGMSLSTYKVLEINIISSFYAFFLPSDLLGGAVRWYKMSQPDGRRAEAAAAIVFNRLIDTIGLSTLGVVFLLVDPPKIPTQAIALGFLVILGSLIAIFFVGLKEEIAFIPLKYLQRYRTSFIPDLMHEKLSKVLNSVMRYRHFSFNSTIAISSLTLIRLLLSIAIVYLFALGLDINITFLNTGWIYCVFVLAIMLPITISGLGVREGTFVFLLHLYGVAGTKALALSFLLFFMRIFIASLGGLLEVINVLLSERIKQKNI
jgi:uncharacterized protein (TIRG00374 family)